MTGQVAPETIFNDLLTEVVDLLHGKEISPFELKRLDREIDKLGKADRAGSWELKAHVSAARGEVSECIDLFTRALSQTDDFTGSVLRMMLVLARLGESAKVKELFVAHRNMLRTNPSALRSASTMLSFSGWLITADEATEDLRRMGIKPANGVGGDPQTLNNRGFSEEDIAEAVGFAQKFLRSVGMYPRGVRNFGASLDPNTDCVFFSFGFEAEPERLAAVEMELFAALAEKEFPVVEQRFLVFGLMPGWDQQDADTLH
ncbi:hypothetical protein J2X02_003385 [Pseudoxanthomonas japonensis]|uniref:hypothetical protein n=1 Tax=Pseudoxanthomonas japonensis TaxID=69284 RepID=UPI002855C1C6|nr:hypothetical protein [Pseudoxanthomonas japonensis]MDR7070520.1 hypothetical protein [Pseudoxanthomonas japonensis]